MDTKKRGQNPIFAPEAFDCPATKYTSNARASMARYCGSILGCVKVSKFQEQEYRRNAFPLFYNVRTDVIRGSFHRQTCF